MSQVNKEQAVELLKNSEVVALPTETVYGLAGLATSDVALNKIFSTKSRPFYDPLIVHVKSLGQAEKWGVFDPLSKKLASTFWPGPLTLVLPKTKIVSDLITNGGKTVALRSPDHLEFQNILELLDAPLAAPSANMFGKTSPTSAQHVLDEFSFKVPVLDGGECEKGIESTVIEVLPKEKTLSLLRPGIINLDQLNEFLRIHQPDYTVFTQRLSHSPGNLKNHYQPDVPFILIRKDNNESINERWHDVLIRIEKRDWYSMSLPSDPALAARQLYSQLRHFSKNKQAFYLPIESMWEKTSSWSGLLDRLEKASTGSLHFKQDHWTFCPKN